ncbi:NADPH:quinone reductase-like Zn-dependent oxidoreductase [Nonomuraea angiospora]|uniref:NADPH:quinone reductase-like Zn-dependent oxidoreductase n=2 Tax=Nonomuraea angiospora TaxID=46172 RepID=A0ABR9M399_9ACTN|nr:NADPH:quinone reductase-like Zn-dependent oxidoreductase [Nonomuraea angiospora]
MKMKAISQDVLGGPEVLKTVEVERPVPGPTEVLVRVEAAGLNPTDWKTRAGGGFLRDELPFVLGYDVSGVVEDSGVGQALYKPGDEVFGMLKYPDGHGAFAEYVTAPSRHFVRKPAAVDHVQAAGIPLAGLTAYQALVDVAGLKGGQRVLIHAAAGGVGHLAVQIAKARGAYVIGTASAAKHEFLRGLGADELVDYRNEDFAEVVRDVDVVLETIGGDYGLRSLRTLRKGGTIVSLVLSDLSPELHRRAAELGIRSEGMLVEPDHAAMRALAALVEAGRLRVEIAAALPLAEAAKAHELGETNRVTGKIVLTVPH